MPVIEVSRYALVLHHFNADAGEQVRFECAFDYPGIREILTQLADIKNSGNVCLLTDFNRDQLSVKSVPGVGRGLYRKTKKALIKQLQGDAQFFRAHSYTDSQVHYVRQYCIQPESEALSVGHRPIDIADIAISDVPGRERMGSDATDKFLSQQATPAELLLLNLVTDLRQQGHAVVGVVPVALAVEGWFSRIVSLGHAESTALVIVTERHLVRCYFFKQAVLVYQRTVPVVGENAERIQQGYDTVWSTHAFVMHEYCDNQADVCPVYRLATDFDALDTKALEPDRHCEQITAADSIVLPEGRSVSSLLVRQLVQLRRHQSVPPSNRSAMLRCVTAFARPKKLWQDCNCLPTPLLHDRLRQLPFVGLWQSDPRRMRVVLMLIVSMGLSVVLWQRWQVMLELDTQQASLEQTLRQAQQAAPPLSLQQIHETTERYVKLGYQTQSPVQIVRDLAKVVGAHSFIRLQSLSWQSDAVEYLDSVDERIFRVSHVVLKGEVRLPHTVGASVTSTLFTQFDTFISALAQAESIDNIIIVQSPVGSIDHTLQADARLHYSEDQERPDAYHAPFVIEFRFRGFVS